MAMSTTLRPKGAIRKRLLLLTSSRGQPSFSVRLVYLTLGAFFALLTTRVLLWEVHSVADLTVEHYLTIGAIIGAIASGVYFSHMLRQFKFISALVFGVVCLAATAYCLIGSAGRSDEMAFERNAAARQVNKERERALRDRDAAKRRYDTALDAETVECGGGQGPKCISKRATTQDRRFDLEAAELLLQRTKPEQRENGKLKRAAQVIALFSSATEEGAERGLAILWPFLPPFICELLTISFLHLGFGHRPAPRTVARTVTPTVPVTPEVPPRPSEPLVTVQATIPAEWTPVSVERARELAGRAEAEGVFDALRSVQPKAVSNDELAAMLSVSKAESSRRVSDLVRVGLVSRQPAGRYVAISLRPLLH